GWIGWLKAVALLDDAGLDQRARLSIADGRIAPLEFGAAEFDAARAGRAASAERLREETAPITDAAALRAQWYGYTEAGIAARRKAATLGLSVGRDTHVNPYRGIGRNDPCPCGSGRKFKKCHGA
ncbi:MAG: SEC-C metal-binding domain-containing protein, partial [Rhodospirillales bacterium]